MKTGRGLSPFRRSLPLSPAIIHHPLLFPPPVFFFFFSGQEDSAYPQQGQRPGGGAKRKATRRSLPGRSETATCTKAREMFHQAPSHDQNQMISSFFCPFRCWAVLCVLCTFSPPSLPQEPRKLAWPRSPGFFRRGVARVGGMNIYLIEYPRYDGARSFFSVSR